METPNSCYCIASPLSNWRLFIAAVLWLAAGSLSAAGADFLTEGEKQLSLNNPAKAVTYLEAALAQGDPSEKLLLDLGLAYQRTGQGAEARKTFRQGADLGGPAQKTFLLNLGISAFLDKDWKAADAADTEALVLDPTYPQALLNRAQARLGAEDWAGAAADYRAYQTAAPANPQKDKIDQVLALLDQAALDDQAVKLAQETRKKKQDEEKKAADAQAAAEKEQSEAAALAKKQADDAAAETQRQADEAAAAAEKQKQEEILAKVRESLDKASDDSQALSTGPADAKADNGDFSLEP